MSTFESTVSMLEMLSEHEMYQLQTEDQLLVRIDTAIEHAYQGKLRDAKEISGELRARYGI